MARQETTTASLLELVEHEALAARGALGTLTDERVDLALARAVDCSRTARRDPRCERGRPRRRRGKLDAGALDRLRLDDGRLETIAAGILATAELAPIERDLRSWRCPTGSRSPSG